MKSDIWSLGVCVLEMALCPVKLETSTDLDQRDAYLDHQMNEVLKNNATLEPLLRPMLAAEFNRPSAHDMLFEPYFKLQDCKTRLLNSPYFEIRFRQAFKKRVLLKLHEKSEIENFEKYGTDDADKWLDSYRKRMLEVEVVQ